MISQCQHNDPNRLEEELSDATRGVKRNTSTVGHSFWLLDRSRMHTHACTTYSNNNNSTEAHSRTVHMQPHNSKIHINVHATTGNHHRHHHYITKKNCTNTHTHTDLGCFGFGSATPKCLTRRSHHTVLVSQSKQFGASVRALHVPYGSRIGHSSVHHHAQASTLTSCLQQLRASTHDHASDVIILPGADLCCMRTRANFLCFTHTHKPLPISSNDAVLMAMIEPSAVSLPTMAGQHHGP